MSRITVVLVDRDLRSEQPLGTDVTDADGAYRIKYSERQFRRGDKGSADLLLRALDGGGRVLAESQVLFNAPMSALIDLVVPAEVAGGQNLFDRITDDLAPVMDTVPSKRAAKHNPPIGRYDRQFGYTPRVVARHGVAFLRGLADGGVVPTVKHFPGLGRVRANTDVRAGVTDHVTTRHDAYLAPFRAAIDAGAPVVMMSTAYYERLDPENPAAFSPFVIGTMLRGDLG
ncbi:MAG: glycoside hydrolase family 3 protein, partial [Lysobacteraceae bacterium]